MSEDDITDILDLYGLDRILEDNQTTLPRLLDILQDLGYIDLAQYDDTDVD